MPRATPKSKITTKAKAAKKPKPTKTVRKIAAKRRTAHPSPARAGVLTLVPVAPLLLATSSFSLAKLSFEDALQLTPLFELTIQTARQRYEQSVRSELIAAGVITVKAKGLKVADRS